MTWELIGCAAAGSIVGSMVTKVFFGRRIRQIERLLDFKPIDTICICGKDINLHYAEAPYAGVHPSKCQMFVPQSLKLKPEQKKRGRYNL